MLFDMFALKNGLMLQAFTGAGTDLLPLAFMAILLDAAIVAVWYMIGAVTASSNIKSAARSEFYQLIGTAIIAALIIGSLMGFGLLYLQSVNPINSPTGTVLSPMVMAAMCNSGPLSSPYMNFVGTAINLKSDKADSLCNVVNQVAKGNYGTDGSLLMDYPLAASGLIIANLTDQSARNFNSTFITDAWLGFWMNLQVTAGICVSNKTLQDGSCSAFPLALPTPLGMPPIPGAAKPELYLKWAFTPLNGFQAIIKNLESLTTFLYTALGAFTVQLLFIDMFIYAWPFLIFIGLVLRGLFFTRKLGGLLIAIGIGAILFYPTISSIEYLASNNPDIVPMQAPLTFCGNNGYTYTPNFFVAPSLKGIAQDCGCWPSFYGLFQSESLVWTQLNSAWVVLVWPLSFITNLASNIGSGSVTGLPAPMGPRALPGAVYPACPVGNQNSGSEGMILSFAQVYGIMGISQYFLPVLNVLITLTAILGLSGLLGGEVNIPGLSRFI